MHSGKMGLKLLLAVVLFLFMLTEAFADVSAIPLDMLAHGTPPKKEGWITPAREYQDESIHATIYERKNYMGSINSCWVFCLFSRNGIYFTIRHSIYWHETC